MLTIDSNRANQVFYVKGALFSLLLGLSLIAVGLLGVPTETFGTCIPSEEICGNGIDEDCSGSDLRCEKCESGFISKRGCVCGGNKRYTGYCCGNNWQATPCGGRIFFIDKNGNDSHEGTQFRPWKSLFNAIKHVKPGDTVLINPGKYMIDKKLSIKTSGMKDRPIIIRGNGENIVLDFSKCNDRNGFSVHFANYVNIENLTIFSPQKKNSRGIRLTHSKGSVIRNNKVSGAGHANIFCSHSDRILIMNNETFDGRIGVYVADSTDYPTVTGNVVYRNSAIGLHMNGDKGSGGDGIISHAIIENNIFFDNGMGINIDGVTDSVFRNNLLYDNKKKGMAFFKGDGAVPSENNLVIHNTIVMPIGASYSVGLNYGAYKNDFYNNIIIAQGKVPVFSTTGKASDLKVSSDYNLFSKNALIWEIEDSAYRFGRWEKMIRKSLNKISQYVGEKENDAHSLEAEIGEIFVDFEKGDFLLKPDSPAIDKGTPKHSYGKDLRGNIRPKSKLPDIGAYENYPKKHYSLEKAVATHRGPETQEEVSKTGIPHKAHKAQVTEIEKFNNKFGMEFRYIPPGSFKMGMDCSAPATSSNCHQVDLTKGYYMQTTEVTQSQWKSIMGDNPSFFQNCGGDCPIEQVSWNVVQEFLERLNKIENSGKYRLPTEAEWEYACKAGTETPFSFGSCLTAKEANYDGNFPFTNCPKEPYLEMPVSTTAFLPNPWGFVGMHGNVWEWCSDWLGDYSDGADTNPKGPAKGSLRVIRGGGWNSYAQACRSGNRSGGDPSKGFANLGFRVVREP